MIKSVIANRVALPDYLLKHIRVFFYVVANTKESCPGIPFFQFFQNKISGSGNRSVIECEIELFRSGVNPPQQLWIK